MKNQKLKNNNGGYSLIELLFYVSIFIVLTISVINSIIVMTRSFRESSVFSELVQSGGIMERISREIRGAEAINTISSSDLTLDTKDAMDVDKTVRFALSGSDVQMYENGGLVGTLNSPTIAVTVLSFESITTSEGQAVKIFMTLRSLNDKEARTYNFYNTVVLRGAY